MACAIAVHVRVPCCARFRLGERVVAFVGSGGFATDLIAKESSVAPLPPGMGFVEASSFLVAYGTADYALRVRRSVSRKSMGDVSSCSDLSAIGGRAASKIVFFFRARA